MDYAYTTQNSLGWHKRRNRKAARPLNTHPRKPCCRHEHRRLVLQMRIKLMICVNKYQNKRNKEINLLVFIYQSNVHLRLEKVSK